MNTANKLTLLRVLLVPVFMAFMMIEEPICQAIALGIFILASVTDALDGYIARSRNQITNFGKFADPLADKMLTTAAFIALLSCGRMSAWALMLILLREFIVSGIRLVAVTEGKVIAASLLGKIKTVSQMVAIIAAVLMYLFLEQETAKLVSDILIWFSTVATIISGADYVIKNWKLLELE